MSAPWFKMYSADYLLDRDISMLSMEGRGILITIWCVLHRDKHIPDNADLVAAIIHTDPKIVRKHWMAVRKHLEPGIYGLYSKRMEKERMEYDAKCAKLKENAKAGGKARAKQKDSNCSAIAEQNPAEVEEKEKRTEVPPYPLAGVEGDGLASLKAVWPKGRINGVRVEHLQEALDTGATLDGLVHAAEAFLADPAACSGLRFAPALTTWLDERRWEPYLPTEAQDGPFELAPDPLAVNHE